MSVRRQILSDLERLGYSRVKARCAFSARRREVLREMATEGLCVLNLPITGSYLTYSKPTLPPPWRRSCQHYARLSLSMTNNCRLL